MTGHRMIKLSFIFALLIILPNSPVAFEADDNPAPYIDLDGDGLDDNAPDDDSDGIANIAESNFVSIPDKAVPAETGLVSFEAEGIGLSVDSGPNSGKFSHLNRDCRQISNHRGGFGSGDQFGPGNGIGIGAVSSGGCVGGVCH